MNINEIFQKANTGNINDLIPIKSIENPFEYFQISETDLLPTYEKVCELYGKDIADDCYYFDGLIPEVVYFNKETYVIVKLTGAILTQISKEELRKQINFLAVDIKKDGLEKHQFFIPSEFQMSLMDYYLSTHSIQDYSSFIDMYAHNEYNFSQLSRDKLNLIFQQPHKKIGQKFIKTLPETVTIYRGEGDKSTPVEKALSWTLSKEVAFFFACKNSNTGSSIYTAQIKREAILDYLDDRNEEEILAFPEDVKILNKVDLPSVMEVSDTYPQEFANVQYVFQHICEEYNEIIKGILDKTFEHGINHLYRVSILSGMIHELVREDYDDLNDTTLIHVMKAGLFHDIGRENDEEDTEHGKRSIELLDKHHIHIRKDMRQIIEYHCKDDSLFPECSSQMKILYQILKDADALDRVRFGIRALNTRYLRLDISKSLVFFAYQLLHYKLYDETD
ncbi:HD domain-containing protein [Massilimicrobiota timonensis]|uniref:HD domain-containing protein n=1 Tax=Massilimicrobiota timonensis TaxID=1776392 RepID=UPI00101B967C|nr:HD domain-containing protein [Massilimicrobiota timonensis]